MADELTHALGRGAYALEVALAVGVELAATVFDQRLAETDDLLQLSKVGRGELHRTRVDLSGLARRVSTELQRVNPDRRVEVLIADGIVADADCRLLQAVLENLLGNAWKFTAPVSEAVIEFGVAQQDGVPAYFVRDNGGFQHDLRGEAAHALPAPAH